MNPTASTTVAGDLATMWRRLATGNIVQTVVVANRLRMRTELHLHPTRCRLFRRVPVARVPVVTVDAVAVAMAHIADQRTSNDPSP